MDEIPTLTHDAIILLETYAPSICKCVVRNSRSRSSVIRKYDERWASMKDSFEKSGIFKADTCVFDLLWRASEKDRHAISFLEFMDNTVKNALAMVELKTSNQIKDLVVKMVTSFGRSQSAYRNHFAELAVITKLMEDKSVCLNSVEKKLSNGCKADFEIIKDGKPILVEVYNVNFDIGQAKDSNGLKVFLEKRLTDKISSKLKNIDNLPSPIVFVPVLWGDIMKIREFVKTFDYFKNISLLSPFMFVAQYQNIQTGEIVYRFESLYNHMH